jgi:secreted Zn-dependent insulinase-like peptidase
LETLNFPSTRDDLIKFYNTYYSSNLMKGVILSHQSLDEIQALAEKCFSDIPNKNFSKPTYSEQPFDSSNLGKIMKIVPIKAV